MIAISYQQEYFDLSDGEKITAELVSTVFNEDDDFLGSYTYPVKAPFSPKNNRLVKNAHLIENRSSRYQLEVTLYVFERPYKKCRLTFDVTAEGYSMYLAIDNAVFAGLIKATSLQDLFTVYEAGVFKNYITLYMGHSRAETLAQLAYAVQNPGAGPCVFFPYRNEKLIGEFSGTAAQGYENGLKYFNPYHGSFEAPAGAPSVGTTYFYTPFFYLRWMVQQVCAFLGFEATGEFISDERVKGLTMYNSALLPYDQIFSDNGCLLTPVQHLPGFKLNDFIKELRSTFKLAIDFNANDRKAYFNYAPEIIESRDVVDISGQTEPGFEIKAYTPSGYELVQQLDDRDAMFTLYEYTKSFFIGDQTEPKELTGIAGTVFSTTSAEPRSGTSATWRLPWMQQEGNTYSPVFSGAASFNDTTLAVPELSRNEFGLRLINYRGLQPDSAGQLYPYASGDDLDSDGFYRACPVSLWLGGERGMIGTFQRSWLLYFLRTEQVELSAYLTAAKLLELSPLRRVVWRTETQVLMSALLSQLSFETSDARAGRLAAKLTVFPVYGMAAAGDPAYLQITAGTVINQGGVASVPVTIYVRLRTVQTSITYHQVNGFNSLVWTRDVDVYFDFFSDAAGTAAYSVQDLKVKLDYHYQGTGQLKKTIDEVRVFSASGSSYKLDPPIGRVYYYVTGSSYQVTYKLTVNANGDPAMPGYTVIG